MKSKISAVLMIFFVIMITGCGNQKQSADTSLLGLEWFSSIDDVKEKLNEMTITGEREIEEKNGKQTFIDYSDAELLDVKCEITLNFTDLGLIGLNYHDINKERNFREWNDVIQDIYGIPTEKGNGMASWYKNPVGKNTALYVFNLEEGVQISFYSTSNTPDKTYSEKKREEKYYVPVPELRTPIVPIEPEITEKPTTQSTETTESVAETVTQPKGTSSNYEKYENIREEYRNTTAASSVNTSSATTTTAVTETTVTTTLDLKNKDTYKQKELEFYITPEFTKKLMSEYELSDEYLIDEKGDPWEKILEFSDVKYFDKSCDVVLCFTSLGLVGINYFDSNTDNFDYWTEKISSIYGKPYDSRKDYAIWNKSPLGKNTMICIFRFDDEVQISFFADDTGSEISE